MRRLPEIFLEESQSTLPREIGGFLAVARATSIIVEGVVDAWVYINRVALVIGLQC